MKNIKKIAHIAGWILLIVGLLSIGVSIGYKIQDRYGNDLNGTPKTGLPPAGSVVRVEASFEDGTFVGTYANQRRYYKAPTRVSGGVAIVLEAGKAYEVVETKREMGRLQIALIPIR